ncbi:MULTISPECIES: hypothetical protein [unclassified Pseudovibrio]|uniref:hypothetical protein n=1 Tax=unclassified Pseudovibrio TaxID=2627060 RepID=UPI0007AE5282|nr:MULTISPECIES: hypothetical protein [unclassified Pseudovibrio]KZK93281.1 hypothetical protein PsW74_05437 [Pseudovibrio sp. W74]KZL07172.1 hypothetical protein PsAD14_04640 [Pseudovibrio sp. Ad14]
MRVLVCMLAFVAATLMSSSAFAGAGAVVYACVKYTNEPSEKTTINFQAGGSGDYCMRETGRDNFVEVERKGVSCVSVGYVEADDRIFSGCSTSESNWSLSYFTDDQTESGSTSTDWSLSFGLNTMDLKDQVPNTHVCPSEADCVSSTITWPFGETGPLYIQFDMD